MSTSASHSMVYDGSALSTGVFVTGKKNEDPLSQTSYSICSYGFFQQRTGRIFSECPINPVPESSHAPTTALHIPTAKTQPMLMNKISRGTAEAMTQADNP